MSPEEHALQTSITKNPVEVVNHHAYADWLAENGRPHESEFRRHVAKWLESRPDITVGESGDDHDPVTWGVRLKGDLNQSNLPAGVRLPWYFADTYMARNSNPANSTDESQNVPREEWHGAFEPNDGELDNQGEWLWRDWNHLERSLRNGYAEGRERIRRMARVRRRYNK